MKSFRFLSLIAGLSVMLASCAGSIDPEDNGGNPDDGSDRPGDVTGQVVSVYQQKMVAMQFTSVGCVNCPFLADAIKDVQQKQPGKIIPVAFHMNYDIEDPMTLPECGKFYERVSYDGSQTIALPMCALNFRKSSQRIVNESAKIISEISHQAQQYPVSSGVAVSTEYDNQTRSLTVTAKFISETSKVARYHIILVEDGIEYMQVGSETSNYVHNNVFRYVASDDMRGARLNSGDPLTPGKEYEVTKKITLKESWNPESMRVVVALLTPDGSGDVFGCNNANECAVGASVDYLYKDEK